MSIPLKFLVKHYGNIKFMHIDDVEKFVEDSPFKKILADGTLDEGPYSVNNHRNIFRILLLHLYGGVYFDLDVISLLEFFRAVALKFCGVRRFYVGKYCNTSVSKATSVFVITDERNCK